MSPITTREFVREFSRLKKAAANGHAVHIRDREGRMFVFEAQKPGLSLGEQLKDLCGSIPTGRQVKTLEGYGRNRR